jgi:SNF2 family DNA or RNA helicase
MNGPKGGVIVRVDGEEVLVLNEALLTDRPARLLFSSLLGGKAIDGGWRIPRRRASVSSLVIRVNNFLESKGWTVTREGIVDVEVQRQVERKRSFARTREKATEFREGVAAVDAAAVQGALRAFGWSEDARKLKPHQTRAVLHGLTSINGANFSVPGAGKTATTLAVAAAHLHSGTIDAVLVVGPLSSFAPWESETRAALPRVVAVRRVRGTASERRSAYAAAGARQILLTSYASAAADKTSLIELCKRMKVMLVVDESHRIKRFKGGLWAPALIEIARHAVVRFVLSGTPMPQSGRDLYAQLNVLWPDGDLTGPRDAFAVRVERHFPQVLQEVVPFVSRTSKAELGLPPYEVKRHEVEMARVQTDVYELIESRFRKGVENAASWQEKIDALRRARPIRLLQAAANPDLLNRIDSYYGLPRVESANPTLLDRLSRYKGAELPAKSAYAIELIRKIAEEGGKVVCWSNFVPNLDSFTALVVEQLGIPAYQIDGRVPAGDDSGADDPSSPRLIPESDTRERIIEQFLGGDGPAVLVTNPASTSESISLHRSCRNAIYLDRTYDCALFLQSIDRIHRLGLPPDAKVTVHILLATASGQKTIDHLADASLRRKEAAMRQLLEGAELKPMELGATPLETAEGDIEDLAILLRYLLGEEG